jgi:hypothetical protein
MKFHFEFQMATFSFRFCETCFTPCDVLISLTPFRGDVRVQMTMGKKRLDREYTANENRESSALTLPSPSFFLINSLYINLNHFHSLSFFTFQHSHANIWLLIKNVSVWHKKGCDPSVEGVFEVKRKSLFWSFVSATSEQHCTDVWINWLVSCEAY